MHRRRHRVIVVVSAVALVVLVWTVASSRSTLDAQNGCGWQAAQRPAVRGAALGDIDGDGRLDHVSVVARYRARAGCRFALRVRLATGRVLIHRLADPLIDGSPADLRDLAWPRLLAIADVDLRRGAQPIVSSDVGASAVSAGVFAVRDRRLMRLVVPGGDFSSGASRTASAVDCWHGRGSGSVVQTFAVADPSGWTVSRRTYRLIGQRFRLSRPVPPSFRVKGLAALPEFSGGDLAVFPSCIVSRPR